MSGRWLERYATRRTLESAIRPISDVLLDAVRRDAMPCAGHREEDGLGLPLDVVDEYEEEPRGVRADQQTFSGSTDARPIRGQTA